MTGVSTLPKKNLKKLLKNILRATKMADFTEAQKRRLIRELEKASRTHQAQADRVKKTLKKTKGKK